MFICLERDADLHMAQLMPMPLTVFCFSKIQIGFSFLVPAHPGSPGQRAVKRARARARACVRACVCVTSLCESELHIMTSAQFTLCLKTFAVPEIDFLFVVAFLADVKFTINLCIILIQCIYTITSVECISVIMMSVAILVAVTEFACKLI